MEIVMNEHEWAEEMITSHSLGKRPYETLRRVARYYLDQEYAKKAVRKMLETFLLQCDPTVSIPKWSDTIDAALECAVKYQAVEIDRIRITKQELERIESLDKKQLQRLAFTLLCLAKYWMEVNPKCNWWVTNKDSDIMKAANINTSVRRQSLLYSQLRDAGMIEFSRKVDNTNVRVCFAEDGDTALEITDFRNIGNQYLLYTGSNDYIKCERCGIVVRKNRVISKDQPGHRGHTQQYCKNCAEAGGSRGHIHIKGNNSICVS